MLDLVHVRSFVMLASELNFSRAAKRLNMTQPPLSRQIQLLEDYLGVQLFDRTRRSVSLSAAGRIFLPEARALLQRVADAEHIARRASEFQDGSITLGFMGILSYSFLPRFLQEAKRQYPNISIVLKEMSGVNQVEALEFGQIDIGLVRPMSTGPTIKHRCVMRRDLAVAVPLLHHLAARQRIALKDLHEEPFVMYDEEATYMHRMLAAAFETHHTQPRFVQKMAHAQVILSLVSVGMGIAIVPEETRAACFDNIVFRPITLGTDMLAETHAIWRSEDKNPLLPAFIELASRIDRSLSYDGMSKPAVCGHDRQGHMA